MREGARSTDVRFENCYDGCAVCTEGDDSGRDRCCSTGEAERGEVVLARRGLAAKGGVLDDVECAHRRQVSAAGS